MKIMHPRLFKKEFRSDAVADNFIRKFKEWKEASDPCSFWLFGRDVSTTIPRGHLFDRLMHVHLTPRYGDEARLQKWNWQFVNKSQNARCDRTSDNLLFYAISGDAYLLIGFQGHSTGFTPDQLRAMCYIADQWVRKI